MNDCTMMSFLCGLLIGIMLGISIAIISWKDDYQELKQFREEKLITQKLNERDCHESNNAE